MGSFSPSLLRPLGIPCNVYPAKGYSATFPVLNPGGAPTVSLTDSSHKVVFSRLGDRLRMAGTAELSGYSRGLNTGRCEAMTRLARELFPTRSISSASAIGRACARPLPRTCPSSAAVTFPICISIPDTVLSAGRWASARAGHWPTC
ncbi:FAD-dependent oxidoreductase [Achromobacter insuavis]